MTMDADDKSKDAIPEGQDSEGESQKDSQEPKTYTEDEVEKKFSQQRSVLDKKIATLEKKVSTFQGVETEISKLKGLISQQEKEDDNRAIESFKDDPEALKEYRGRKTVREDRAKLSQEKADFERTKVNYEDDLKELRAFKSEKDAHEVAERLSVDVQPILKYLTKVQDASPEDIEEFAGTLTKRTDSKTPLKLDSSKTIGGKGKKPTLEELQAASPAEYDAKKKSGDWIGV